MYMLVIVAVVGSTLTGSQVVQEQLTLSECNARVEQVAAEQGHSVSNQFDSRAKVMTQYGDGFKVYASCAKAI